MAMKSLSIYHHEFLNRWYRKAERYHPMALKEPRLRPSEMRQEGQERAQDQKEEVTLQGTGEETELQQKMLQVRDRAKGSERKHLVIIRTYSLALLAVSQTDQTAISQMDYMLWTPSLALVQAGAWCRWVSSWNSGCSLSVLYGTEPAHLPVGVIFCLWFSRVQSILGHQHLCCQSLFVSAPILCIAWKANDKHTDSKVFLFHLYCLLTCSICSNYIWGTA